MEPEMSRMRMSGLVRSRRLRQKSSAGSPCIRMVSRTVRRRSGRRPDREAMVRRVQRRGGVRRIRAMMRRRAASSAGVHAAKDLSRRTSASEAISPRLTASSSWPAPPASVAGTCNTDWAGVASRSIAFIGSASTLSSRKNRRNTRS